MEIVSGYCVDSDILVDYLRGFNQVHNFLLDANSNDIVLYISVVSVIELYAGRETLDMKNRFKIDQFLENFIIILPDLSIAKRAGILRRDYQKPFADMIVAATALHHDLTLVTRNVKHFQIIKDLKVLQPY